MGEFQPRWQPISGIRLAATAGYLSPTIARHLLNAQGTLDVTYVGDRLWPAVPHGTRLRVERLDPTRISVGALVLVVIETVPDLLRIERLERDQVGLAADADPTCRHVVSLEALLGTTAVPPRHTPRWRAALRRRQLDLLEALRHTSDTAGDAASTVQAKYDTQAPFYDDRAVSTLPQVWHARFAQLVSAGSRVIVAGCGAGAECRELARRGYRLLGLDFSAEMIVRARRATPAELPVEYQVADLRTVELAAESYEAVVFTPDVYSFVPESAARIALLARLRASLTGPRWVALSARLARDRWTRALLRLQWIASSRDRQRGLGSTHTRWTGDDGALHRSFIQIFSPRQLHAEIAAAGFRCAEELCDWLLLEPLDR